MMVVLKHPLRLWREAGFLPHPILPVTASVHPEHEQGRGKAPGVLREGSTSEWALLRWTKVDHADPNTIPALERSVEAGAGIGVRTENFLFVDSDIMDLKLGQFLMTYTESHFGTGPVRIGQHPKWAMAFKGIIDSRTFDLFRDGEKVGHIDLLGKGRQIVVQGTHAKTGGPYVWDIDPLGIDTALPEIPEVTEEQVAAWVAGMPEWAASHGLTMRGGAVAADSDGSKVDQASLRWPGEPPPLLEAVAATPHPPETTNPERLLMGRALKAALPDHPDLAREAFIEWSLKWTPHDPLLENTAEEAGRRFDGLRGPFSHGYHYILSVCAKTAGIAAAVFALDPLPADWQPPDTRPQPRDTGPCPLSTLDVAAYRLDRQTVGEAPEQQFLVRGLIPLGVPGLVFGEGGLGKSIAALDLAIAVAAGQGRVLGHEVDAQGAAVFLTLEDSVAEIHRRTLALDPQNRRAGAPVFVISGLEIAGLDPALVATGLGRVAALTTFAKTGLDDLLRNVARVSGVPVRLLILDPAGDFMAGDENDAQPVKMLMRLLREKAAAHGGTILLVGHTAKGASGSGSMRGSGAWTANARFAYGLRRPDPKTDAPALKTLAKAGIPAEQVVIGQLTKANHAGAPLYQDRFFRRDPFSGRLVDVTARLAPPAPEAALLAALVAAVRDYAAAGMPFKVTGGSGLFAGRADLPDALAGLSKHRLETLGTQAVEAGALVKCAGPKSKTPDYLDVPDGPYATGGATHAVGSRAEALAAWRAVQGGAA